MAKSKKAEKYPILRYLSYLVIVSILLTGVSLARYTGATSGDVSASLSRFICSYEIKDASSLTFSNTDYWLEVEDGMSATNTARSVRFDLRNHLLSADGSAGRTSDVALQSTVRLYAPAEFAGNLALQFARVEANGEYTVLTPQYVLGDLIYEVSDTDGDGKYDKVPSGTERTFATDSRTIRTGMSQDYSDRTDGLTGDAIAGVEEVLSVSGGFTGTKDAHTGTVTALSASSGTELTITSSVQTARYSVGFTRTEARGEDAEVGGGTSAGGKMAPLLYLDCERETAFYTVDLTLPAMYFDAGVAQSKSFVLFLTAIDRVHNSDFTAIWGGGESGTAGEVGGGANEWADLLREPVAGTTPYTFNGARVLGYHFTRDLPVYNAEQSHADAPAGKTTVRITKTYDYANGGAVLAYDHVAPVSEIDGSASVVHSIASFYADTNGTAASPAFTSVKGVNGWADGAYNAASALFGRCENAGKSGYIWFGNLSDDPFYDTYDEQTAQGKAKYELSDALSKGYSTTLNVLFAQASGSPAAQASGASAAGQGAESYALSQTGKAAKTPLGRAEGGGV